MNGIIPVGAPLLLAAELGAWQIVLICVLAFLGLGLLLALPFQFLAAYFVFVGSMTRKSKDMWSRERSADDPETCAMYDEGMAWAEKHADKKKELHIVNEGFNLYAEYFDFGYDRAVIVVPGRTEGLRYGYYFAAPYEQNGCNVLTIDQRAHGESDGKYNCIGHDEHRDLLRWAQILHDEYGVREIVLHGICIGAACSIYALTHENAPDYITALVAEGMYPNFYESFKYHMVERKKPTFIILDMIDWWMKHYTGHTFKIGPIDKIDRYEKPLLMLHGTADFYSKPEAAKVLYETCASEKKELVWFQDGRHSRLRYMDRDRYDGAIDRFLKETVFAEEHASVR